MNKKINSYLFFIYTYTHLCFFIFLFYFFGLGPAQPIGARLDPASPARVTGPSQWPGWAKCGARVKWFQACIHCAKVIKLPSHSVLWSFNFKERKGMKSWRTCFWSGEDGCNAGGDFCLLDTFTSTFPFCSYTHGLLSFSSKFWDNEGTENEGAGFCGYWFLGRFLQGWKQWQNQLSSLCCSSAFLLFQFVLCLPLFSGFFLWVLLQFFPLVLYFFRQLPSCCWGPPFGFCLSLCSRFFIQSPPSFFFCLCSALPFIEPEHAENPFPCSSIHERDHGQEIVVSWPWIAGFVSCWIGLVRAKWKGWWIVGSKRRHLAWKKWQIMNRSLNQ